MLPIWASLGFAEFPDLAISALRKCFCWFLLWSRVGETTQGFSHPAGRGLGSCPPRAGKSASPFHPALRSTALQSK